MGAVVSATLCWNTSSWLADFANVMTRFWCRIGAAVDVRVAVGDAGSDKLMALLAARADEMNSTVMIDDLQKLVDAERSNLRGELGDCVSVDCHSPPPPCLLRSPPFALARSIDN